MESIVDTTKITASIQIGLLERFETDMRECFLKRDAFLDQVIAGEIPNLRHDLAGKRLSQEAKTYISRKLKRMGTRPVNFVVSKEVAAALREATHEFNLVRDAFMNYLLMCLRCTPKFLKYFELPSHYTSSHFQASMEPPDVSPMAVIRGAMSDPFYYLREAVMERHETGLYTLELPEQFHGFSCYLPDESVPGSEANKKLVQEVEQLLAGLELDELEQEAFKKKKKAKP
jgi:hypothetical protein